MASIQEQIQKQLEAKAAMAQAGLANPDGTPILPKLSSPLDSNGELAEKYKAKAGAAVAPGLLDAAKLGANQDALNKLKDYAMSEGASPWLKLQLEQQGLGELTAMDNAGAQANSSAALARSNLAMKGGLSGGAAERLAAGAGNNLLLARQGIGRAGQTDRLGLNIADQQTKMETLSKIPGFDLQIAGQNQDMAKTNNLNQLEADKFNSNQTQNLSIANTQNTLGAVNQENTNSLDIYKQQMAGYGANETAKATRRGGKK